MTTPTTPPPSPQKQVSFMDTITPLNKLPKQPIRLGLQSAPGEGKTWSALTFPSPIVLNLDNKLGGWQAVHPESNLMVVNFDADLIINKLKISNKGFGKPNDYTALPDLKAAVLKWIINFGKDLTPDQTLLLDSWTTLQNRFDIQYQKFEVSYGKGGAEDGFAFWKEKQRYAGEVMDALKELKCNVVVTFHETLDYNDEGRPTGKLKPLMQGGFAPQIAGHMTDFYRQRCVTKDLKDYEKIKAGLGRDINGKCEWLWQTKADGLFTACASIPNLPDYVPATYESLIKTYASK